MCEEHNSILSTPTEAEMGDTDTSVMPKYRLLYQSISTDDVSVKIVSHMAVSSFIANNCMLSIFIV